MKTITTAAQDVVRIARQFGFKGHGSKVVAVTFSGRRTPGSQVETFVVNYPTQGWNCKDGSVTISNTYACWGWTNNGNGGKTINVFDFKPETIKTVRDGLAVWEHTA